MGLRDLLPFGKKKDDFGLPPMGKETGMAMDDFSTPPQQYPPQFAGGFNPQPQFQQPMESLQNNNSFRTDRDTELISAKLDAIKAMLENLNQRIANLERIAGGEVDMNTINPRRKW